MIEIIPYIILAIEDDGDREFMAWLYIQYQSLLYSEIIRIVQSSTDAEDVLHTVIEKLIDKVGFLRNLIAEDLLIISLPLQRIRLIIIVETKRKN